MQFFFVTRMQLGRKMKNTCVILLAILSVATIILTAAATGRTAAVRNSVCPVDWFAAEFTLTANVTIPFAVLISRGLDPELRYFTEILQFTPREIETARQEATQFFRERFGLDFPSDRNELNQSFFQNATLFPVQVPVNYTVSINRWLVNGNTMSSKCFAATIGGFEATFTGDQMLHGTYGGVEGRPVGPGNILTHTYLVANVCPQQPIVIQLRTLTPGRADLDGYSVVNTELIHPTLGVGRELGVTRVAPVPGNLGLFRFEIQAILTFPRLQ